MSPADLLDVALTWLPAAGASAVVSALVTRGALAACEHWQVLDRPNARSAHREPTPTLGGIGVLAGLVGGGAVLAGTVGLPQGWLALSVAMAALCPLIIDDLNRPLTAGHKLALQALAVAAYLTLGAGFETLVLPGLGGVELGWWSWPVTALWLVAVMNAFNFMDGIDGITATQTITCGIGLALCLAAAGSTAAPLAVLAAAAAAGFLVYNRPPARIFMGDVGAHALGLLLGVLVVVAQQEGLPFWLVALSLGCYLYDTAYTLLRRAFRGENVLRAHSQHLYQRLVRAGWSHGRVDLLLLTLNACLAAGIAMVTCEPLWGGILPGGLLLGGVGLFLVCGTGWLELHDDARS